MIAFQFCVGGAPSLSGFRFGLTICWKILVNTFGHSRQLSSAYSEREEELDQKDEDQLIRLMKIRQYLWT